MRSILEVITLHHAKKELANEAKAYLAYLSLKNDVLKEVEDITIVREFPKAFEELLGIPPTREIKFIVAQEPQTILVHKAPYKMA